MAAVAFDQQASCGDLMRVEDGLVALVIAQAALKITGSPSHSWAMICRCAVGDRSPVTAFTAS